MPECPVSRITAILPSNDSVAVPSPFRSNVDRNFGIGTLAPGQRWSLSRKREVGLRLMQGEPVEGLSRRYAAVGSLVSQ
jgi:hypothetical protein